MKLSELKLKNVNFEICGLDLNFRPFTLADDLKAQGICGGQKGMELAFQGFDFQLISIVAWYQLTSESQKKIIKMVEESYYDPHTGDEVTLKLMPIDKFRKLFVGIGGQISLLTNLIKCKGLNIHDFNETEALKKWGDQFGLRKLTGQ